MTERREVTALLVAWQNGDSAALNPLSAHVYAELRRLAGRAMQREGTGHTLQATALVHEAFLRLLDADIDYRGRQHFFALAARMMRRILVDHARARRSVKRGSGAPLVTLGAADGDNAFDPLPLIELDEALDKLAAYEPKLAEAVELLYFGGLSYEDAADALGSSRTQLVEDLKFAKAWLRDAMSPPA